MKKFFTVTILILVMLSAQAFAQIPPDLTLIAHYNLDGTPDDATGNNGPIQLTNAPYQDGGIFLNGIYTGNDPTNGSDATTPQIDSLNFRKFAIQAKFKISETQTNPVFVGGTGFRWMGFYIFDSTAAFMYNNGNFVSSQTVISLNTFHTATIVYDSLIQTANWYLDGNLVKSTVFAIDHGNDRNISTTNFGMGFVFKGIFDDLKVYSLSSITDVEDNSKGSSPFTFGLEQNYPNPFNPSTMIKYAIDSRQYATLKVFDVLGNEVATLINEVKSPGNYEVAFDASNLTTGVYYYQLRAGELVQTKKMLLLK